MCNFFFFFFLILPCSSSSSSSSSSAHFMFLFLLFFLGTVYSTLSIRHCLFSSKCLIKHNSQNISQEQRSKTNHKLHHHIMSSNTPAPKAKQVTPTDVLRYIPNKIGFSRVITMVLSLFLMRSHPTYTTIVYGISCLLDAVDGTMARKYDQCSLFGAVLDMVSDRSTTACLICYLCCAYFDRCPLLVPVLQLLNALDLSSHYMHMYATLNCTKETTHKKIEKEQWLLNLYYSRRDVLFTVCAFNELFYLALYWYSFPKYSTLGLVTLIICLPGYIFKQIANVIQMNRAAMLLATKDAKDANAKRL